MAKAADGKQEQMRMRAFTDADENRKAFAERHSGEVGRFVFCVCGFEGIV